MPNMTGDQLAMGIKGFLMKPVSRADMTRMIRMVLDEQKKLDIERAN